MKTLVENFTPKNVSKAFAPKCVNPGLFAHNEVLPAPIKLLQWNSILDRILAKFTDVWGKITPMKRAVFKGFTQEMHMLLFKILPQTVKNFTQMPYL